MKLLYRHIGLTLALSILLSSVGVALPQHICLMTGLVQKTPAETKDSCCSKKADDCREENTKAEQAAEDKSCCDVSVAHEKLNPEASLKSFSFQLQGLAPALLPAFQAELLAPLLLTQQEILTYSDSSPPLYGRSLLRKIQILII